jgi:hypothetical protein
VDGSTPNTWLTRPDFFRRDFRDRFFFFLAFFLAFFRVFEERREPRRLSSLDSELSLSSDSLSLSLSLSDDDEEEEEDGLSSGGLPDFFGVFLRFRFFCLSLFRLSTL